MIKFAQGLSLPVDAATQTFGFIAKKRAGKSYAAGVLLEGLDKASVQFGVLDPVGRHYGLRLKADGKGKGIDVAILGGLRGDIPLDPTSGKLVADAFCDTGRSFIFDVSQFSLGERKRFATAFGEQLWLRQKALKDPRPMHIVLEEAQLFLPQFTQSDDARMVGVWTEIVRLGGNVGIGVSLITQRPQSVAKEALTQVECLVVLQVNGVPEKKSLKEWMVEKGGDVNLLDELPFMKQGVAYIWSPTWLEHFGKHNILEKWTFDASSTPKVGVKRVQADLPELDLGVLKQQMEAAVKKGEENDPTALKRQIAELKKQLGKPQVCEVPDRKVVEKPVLNEKELKRLEKLLDRAHQLSERGIEAFDSVRSAVNSINNSVDKVLTAGRAPFKIQMPVIHTKSPTPYVAKAKFEGFPEITVVGETKLAGGALKMLQALAARPSLTKVQIATLAGMSSNSGTFSTYMSQLNTAAFMEKNGDEFVITELGKEYLGPNALKGFGSVQELVDLWKAKFPGKVAALLQHLVDNAPLQMSKDDMANFMGMSSNSGTFSTYLSMLRSNKLVNTSAGLTSASGDFFI